MKATKRTYGLCVLVLGFALCAMGCASAPKQKTLSMASWMQKLQDKDPHTRAEALDDIEQFGARAKHALPLLKTLSKDKDARVRESLMYALKYASSDALPLMIAGLGDPSRKVQMAAERNLRQVGSIWLSAQKKALTSWDSQMRRRAAKVAAWTGRAALPLVPTLIERLNKGEVDEKRDVVYALGQIGAAPASIKALQETYEKNKMWWTLRVRILRAFGDMGSQAFPAVSLLVEALSDKDTHIQKAAIQSLLRIGPIALQSMKQAFYNGTWREKIVVLKAFAKLKKHVKPVMFAILDGLKDEDAEVRRTAAVSIKVIGLQGKAICDALKDRLRKADEQVNVQKAVVDALVSFGTDGVAVLVRLYRADTTPSKILIANGLKGAGVDIHSEHILQLLANPTAIPAPSAPKNIRVSKR